MKTNKTTVEDTDWLHLATHFLAEDIYCAYSENMGFMCAGIAVQVALLNVIVLTLI